MCTLRPQVAAGPNEVVERLRAWMNAPAGEEPAGGGYGWMVDLGGLLARLLVEWQGV